MGDDFKWYEFETRMRKTMFELLEPTIIRINKERERVIKIKKKIKGFDETIGNIETLLGVGKKKSGWMEDIETQIQVLNEKLTNFEVVQEGKNMKFDLNTEKHSIELLSLNKKLDGIVQRNSQMDSQIHIVSNSLSSQTDFLTKYLESNKEEYTNQHNKIMKETCNSQAKFDYVSSQIVELTQKHSNFQMFVEKQRVAMSEISMKLQKLSNDKIENDQLMSETSKMNAKIVQVLEKNKANQDKIHEIFRYLDVYLPKEIQACVSDNFYSIPDKSFLRMFRLFEDAFIRETGSNNSIGESSCIEDIFKRAIGANQRMIKRSNDYKANGELRRLDRMNSKNSFRLGCDDESEEAQSTPIVKNPSYSEFLHVDMGTTSKVVAGVVSEELKKFREEINAIQRRNEVYLEILRAEFETVKKKLYDDRDIFDKELISFSNISEKLETSHKQAIQDLNHLKSSTKDLAEGLFIVFSLLVGEEEELKGLSWDRILEKNPEKNPNPLGTETDRIHHLPNKGFSGKKLRSRSIRHKNQTYDRCELIEILGTLIKTSSTKAKIKLEVPKKVINEPILPPQSKSRMNSASTSRRKIFSFS